MKKAIKFPLEKLNRKVVFLLRTVCIALILLVLLNLISSQYILKITEIKQDSVSFLFSMGFIVILLIPFTNFFVLSKKKIKSHPKLSLFLFASSIIFLGMIVFFSILNIKVSIRLISVIIRLVSS